MRFGSATLCRVFHPVRDQMAQSPILSYTALHSCLHHQSALICFSTRHCSVGFIDPTVSCRSTANAHHSALGDDESNAENTFGIFEDGTNTETLSVFKTKTFQSRTSSCSLVTRDGATNLRCRRGVLRLLVVSDAQEAREPQGDAFFWVHLTGTQSHQDDEVTAGQGCWLPGTGLDSILYILISAKNKNNKITKISSMFVKANYFSLLVIRHFKAAANQERRTGKMSLLAKFGFNWKKRSRQHMASICNCCPSTLDAQKRHNMVKPQ